MFSYNVCKQMEMLYESTFLKKSLYNFTEFESEYLMCSTLFFNTAWVLLDRLSRHFFK